MIRGAPLSLMALVTSIAGGSLAVTKPGHEKGVGRYRWRRNSFFAARREGRRRSARNRRKAARS